MMLFAIVSSHVENEFSKSAKEYDEEEERMRTWQCPIEVKLLFAVCTSDTFRAVYLSLAFQGRLFALRCQVLISKLGSFKIRQLFSLDY